MPPHDEWLKRFITAHGSCQNRDIFAIYHVQQIQTEVARNNFNTALFGKPILKWTDDDIETALRVFQDCEMEIAAPQIAACMQMRKPRSFCETYGIDLKTPVRTFERYLRDAVTTGRARYAQQEAQRKAKIEQEKIEAENKRAQAQKEADRREQQLFEQARRDREFAEEARRSAEREEPKIAEATKQAEEARRARQEAETQLAEIRGRSEAQQKQRQQELVKKRELERAAELEERTRGYQRISIETFLLDGGDLAAEAAKVSISGAYIREGNLSVLVYADMRAAIMAARPKVLLLTDNASREFRQVLLTCQSTPTSAQIGCPVTILGRATKCQLSNAFGTTRDEPCIAVEKGWQ